MQKLIREKLRDIEQAENVRILHAVESGSRSWGFPSTDSDYDVRFIYLRPWKHYMKLQETRDVIELPINELLDISGWDLAKTFRLLYRSNPTLYDWLTSRITYRETDFVDRLRPLLLPYFSPKKVLYHFVHMAARNQRTYLSGDMVQAKKYFYVLRPVLACLWIIAQRTPPPILFTDLVESQLAAELKPTVAHLLDLKMNAPELRTIPRIPELHDYLDACIADIRQTLTQMEPHRNPGWEPLNELFLEIAMQQQP